MIVLAIKLTKNLGCSNNHDNGFDFPPAVTITDTTIDTDRNGCSDTTSMLARFVVICFCLQFVKIRSLLEEVRNSAFTSFQVANLIRKMANAFEDHWGCGEAGTVATESLTEGRHRRPRGIPLLTLVASLLDPRFKFGPGLADVDKEYIWNVILHQMIGIDRSRTLAQQQAQQEQAQQEGHHQDDNQEHHNDDAFHDMFDELNALRMAEGIAEINPVQGEDQAAVTSHDRAHAELLMYRGEPALALQKEDRSYNNPLEWWRVKAHQSPLISELAINERLQGKY